MQNIYIMYDYTDEENIKTRGLKTSNFDTLEDAQEAKQNMAKNWYFSNIEIIQEG